MRLVRSIVVALAAVVLAAGCASTPSPERIAAPVELRVSAASSLRAVLEQTAPEFERATGTKLLFNLGSSGALQQQIVAGAPADVFLSASAKQIDALYADGLLAEGTGTQFAGNQLVVFVPAGNPKAIAGPDDLAGAERLVTGNPETAPHGTKAKEWLEARGLWSSLKPKFVFSENAAQTLDYVARGEADAAIGFASETVGNDAVTIVYAVTADELAPSRYIGAAVSDSRQPDLAEKYLAYLGTADVQQAFVDAGFLPAGEK